MRARRKDETNWEKFGEIMAHHDYFADLVDGFSLFLIYFTDRYLEDGSDSFDV